MQSKLINGINLNYQDQGSGPALVFIHGLGENAASWDAQIDFFSRTFRTITPDLRGHGKSGETDDFITMQLMADDIVNLLQTLNIEHAHFVGLSMGGLLCQELAKNHKKIINTMTLADAAGFYPEEMSNRGLDERLQRIDTMSMEELGTLIGHAACRPEPDPIVLAKAIAMFQNNRPAPYRQATYSTLKADYRQDHAAMADIPTLILVGELDKTTPLAFAQYLNSHLQQSKLQIIPNAAHMSKMENPQAFNRALLEFLTPFEIDACTALLRKP